jgi:cysteine desulfurase/selenocysteine lyase
MSEETKTLTAFDVSEVRKAFPILTQQIYGNPLVYLDNAATTQKPQVVIDELVNYYSGYNSNIHRGVHYLSQKASQAYDDVRVKLQQFIHAKSEKEIIFTRGTTESINLVAATFGRTYIKKGDEIIISGMEHHSNIVPWQLLCIETGAVLKVIPFNSEGELLIEDYAAALHAKTKLVAVVHTSNSLGTINPVKEIIRLAHEKNIPVLLDGAQALVHERIDVQALDCDFLAFSAHKMLGPTGTGALYGKLQLLESMPPYQGGGDMIRSVSFEKTTYNDVPYKFEAGTPNVADVIAWGAAIDYLNLLDRSAAALHEKELLSYAAQELNAVPEVKLIGTSGHKASVVSFVIDGVNALDAGMYLDTLGIAVRTGHHCTEPVMKQLNIPGTVRASFLFYNTKEEVDALVKGVKGAIHLLKKK